MLQLQWLASWIQIYWFLWLQRLGRWIIGEPQLFLLVTHRKCGSRSVEAGTIRGKLTYQCLGCGCLTTDVNIRVITKEAADQLPTDGSVYPHPIY